MATKNSTVQKWLFDGFDPVPSTALADHIRLYADDVLAGARDLRTASVMAYLEGEAFAGRLSAKCPPARAFIGWVRDLTRSACS